MDGQEWGWLPASKDWGSELLKGISGTEAKAEDWTGRTVATSQQRWVFLLWKEPLAECTHKVSGNREADSGECALGELERP